MESINFTKGQFQILHMDGLGQGVSKILDKTTFIAKTLPGEEGDCYIHQKRKNVFFAHLKNNSDLKKISPDRIESECSHFSDCPGCHYLHTSYPNELVFKKNALERELKKLKTETPQVEIIKNEERFKYRNRIVLHYDLKAEKLGIFSSLKQAIVPIPNCLLPKTSIQTEVLRLYNQNSWIDLVQNSKNQPSSGHIEIYQQDNGNSSIALNSPYAHLGFSQVNDYMNDQLKSWVSLKIGQSFPTNSFLIDLFGGSGNLTKNIHNARKILVADNFPNHQLPNSQNSAQKFFSLNLFNSKDLNGFKAKALSESKPDKIDALIVDPPRSGFLQLHECVLDWGPKTILYVSCSPDTQVRDLLPLTSQYSLKSVSLFDMFPGTFHFETAICLERK